MADIYYIDVVNEVLSEMNEVLLTTVNFDSATNIQRHVKEAVNRAYFDINNPEHKWPWQSVGSPIDDRYGNVVQEVSAGTRWYLLNENAVDFDDDYDVDWGHFEVTTEGVGGETAPYENRQLTYIETEEWLDHFADREARDNADQAIGAMPTKVIRSKDGRKFGLSPIPDKAYNVYYYAWERPLALQSHDSKVIIPAQFIYILVARARYYAWQRKEHPENSQIALDDYNKGLKGMRQQSTDEAPNSITDNRIRFI